MRTLLFRPRILSRLTLGCALWSCAGVSLDATPVFSQTPSAAQPLAPLTPGAAPGATTAAPAPRPLPTPPPEPTAQDLATPPAGATRLPSGVSTLQLRASKSKESPRPEDFIAIFALGRRSDGTVVQNTFVTPEPSKVQMSKLFPSWQEALGAMVVGEQRRFWFPASVAPKNPKTGVQEAVVFDIELVAIGRMPTPPSSVAAPDPKAKQVGLGTSILTVSAGKGEATATRRDAALIRFTVWNDHGQMQTSSQLDGRETLFPLDRVMGAFADCIVGMKIGEVRHCWISAAANEGFPGAPRGALVIEAELKSLADAAKVFTPGVQKPK
ncbi:MAG: FKBP-type peptidyl-prolyl cis-trans isomerase [Thermoanaerobaculia bacterium]